jgi:hypothetical protein
MSARAHQCFGVVVDDVLHSFAPHCDFLFFMDYDTRKAGSMCSECSLESARSRTLVLSSALEQIAFQ